MKAHKITLICLILLSSVSICFSQNKSEAILYQEFGRLGCEDIWGRLDGFIADLRRSNATGFIVIHGDKSEVMENLRYEGWIKGIIGKAKSENRIKVVRGSQGESISIQLWKVSSDSGSPIFTESNWSYILPRSIKPFIFTAHSYGDGLCFSGTSYVNLFAEFLLANPNARGHLVIRDKRRRNFTNKEKEVLRELVDQYKVPRNRLKVFFDKDEGYPYDFTDVEFWFVPRSKKYTQLTSLVNDPFRDIS